MQAGSSTTLWRRGWGAGAQYSSSLVPGLTSGEIGHYMLAVLVGLFAGLAAIVFRELITGFDTVLYDWIGGAIGEAGTWPAILHPSPGRSYRRPVDLLLAREAKGPRRT